MRVSAWAGLHNKQAELDFVDIDVDWDTRLFVDPYAIDIRNDAWSAECSRYLRSFFNALIQALRNGQDARAEHLASHLHETNETFLGLSRGRPQGRGLDVIKRPKSCTLFGKAVPSKPVCYPNSQRRNFSLRESGRIRFPISQQTSCAVCCLLTLRSKPGSGICR